MTTINTKEIIKQAEAMTAPLSNDDLKLIRKSFGCTQSEFAKILMLPESSLKKWEQGIRKIDASTTALYLMLIHIRKKQYFPCIIDWIEKTKQK